MNYYRFLLSLAICCGLISSIQFTSAQDQHDSFFCTDYKQGLAKAKEDGHPVFVEITEHGCGFCRLLEQQTLSDPTVRHVLEPYTHVQLWWDGDPEQKALADSLLEQRAFPTLVFLNQKGQPVYTSKGYKKPEPFLAECVKASELLGIAVPNDARSASQGITPSGIVPTKSLVTKPLATSPRNIVTNSQNLIWTAKKEDRVTKMPAQTQSKNSFQEASFAIKNGKYDSGIAILNQLLLSNPKNAEAHYLLAVAYVYTRRNALAAQQYRLVIKLEPNSKLANLAHEGLQKLGM